jgi:hypothetical protein
MQELINACIYLICWLHGMGGNGGISLNDSSRLMSWEVVSRVGAGGFHVSSKKNLGWVVGVHVYGSNIYDMPPPFLG